MLVEGEPYTDDERFCDHPVLVIEILSQSTERYDRSDKFHGYRKIPSLLEYVMVTQDEPRVEVYRRDRGWDLEVYGPGEDFRLEAIDGELALDDVYAGILSTSA